MIEQISPNEFKIFGRIDAAVALNLEKDLIDKINPDIPDLNIDLSEVTYICSAGLRIFLKAQKIVSGNIIVKNMSDRLKEIFTLTGFDTILTIL